MSDSLYGPVDSDIYRAIEQTYGAEQARFLFDLSIVAVNYGERPEQFDHLIHKWALTAPEVENARDFIQNGPFSPKGVE